MHGCARPCHRVPPGQSHQSDGTRFFVLCGAAHIYSMRHSCGMCSFARVNLQDDERVSDNSLQAAVPAVVLWQLQWCCGSLDKSDLSGGDARWRGRAGGLVDWRRRAILRYFQGTPVCHLPWWLYQRANFRLRRLRGTIFAVQL